MLTANWRGWPGRGVRGRERSFGTSGKSAESDAEQSFDKSALNDKRDPSRPAAATGALIPAGAYI